MRAIAKLINGPLGMATFDWLAPLFRSVELEMGGNRGGGAPRNLLAESGLRLRISALVGDEPIAANSCRRGHMSWTNSYTGKGSGAVFFEVEAWEDSGSMRLRLALPGKPGEPATVREQCVGLISSPQPHGGLRWWFVCPRTQNLCTVLHCPPGATAFAGRLAWRMSYLSQRRSHQDRPLEKARGIRMALGGGPSMLEPFPDKPKWMRWATYDRKQAQADVAGRAALAFQAAQIDKWSPGWRERAGLI